MVRMASRKMMSKSGVVVTTTAAGTALGGGTVSAGNTSTAANVAVVTPTVSTGNYTHNNTGSIKQIGGTTAVSPAGLHTVAPANTVSAGTESSSSNTNYKLSIASMLLAMKNQALGSLSLGGSKAGGSITENYSGVNLG